MTVPVMRDIVSSMDSGFDYTFTPVMNAGKRAVWAAGHVESGDWDKVAADAFELSGYAFGLPTSQARITGGYIWDVITGEETPEDLVEFTRDITFRRKE